MNATLTASTDKAEPNPDVLSPKEAVAFLRERNLTALYRRVALKQVPHFRVGRNLRFSRSALERFLASGGTPNSNSDRAAS